MVRRSALVLRGLAFVAFVACGSFQETKIESADGGASESGASDAFQPPAVESEHSGTYRTFEAISPPRPPEDPMRNARLRRLGEFLLGAVFVIGYLIVYWQDTMTFLRNFAHSLRFGL